MHDVHPEPEGYSVAADRRIDQLNTRAWAVQGAISPAQGLSGQGVGGPWSEHSERRRSGVTGNLHPPPSLEIDRIDDVIFITLLSYEDLGPAEVGHV
jgi:hypothetical protein